MDISNNGIAVITREFSKLIHLRKINLSKNRFEYLPPEFFLLKNLMEINLSHNLFLRIPLLLSTLPLLQVFILIYFFK